MQQLSSALWNPVVSKWNIRKSKILEHDDYIVLLLLTKEMLLVIVKHSIYFMNGMK